MHAADSGERDLLRQDDMREQVRRRAAVFLRKADPEETGGRGLAVKLARELLRFIPSGSMRHDFALHEAAHGVAQRLVLVGQRRVRLHGAGSSSARSWPGETCAPGVT